MIALSITASYGDRSYTSAIGVSDAVKAALVQRAEEAMHQVAIELKNALDKMYLDLAKKHGMPWPLGMSENTLSVRSGAGLRSIKDSIRITESPQEVTGVITTGTMTVHETGAVITPKRAQYLTVPLTPALNSQGLPLRSKARDWDNTFIATSKRGNLIIFQKQAGGQIMPLYLLKQSVTIRPRLGMSDMFEQMVPYFQQKAIAALERTFNG